MAMDFPIDLVDGLPIFLEEAASTVAHIGLLGAGLGADAELQIRRTNSVGVGNGRRWPTRSNENLSATCRGRSVAVSLTGSNRVWRRHACFQESEGDNADVIEHGATKGPMNEDQLAVIEECAESDNAR